MKHLTSLLFCMKHKCSFIDKTLISASLSFPICVVVQLFSCVRLFVTPWTVAHQASVSITNSQSLLKFMSIKSVIHPTISSSAALLSSCLQSFPASGSSHQFFSSGGQSIGVSASASVLPMCI